MKKEDFLQQIGQFRKNVAGRLPSVLKTKKLTNDLLTFLFPVLSEGQNIMPAEEQFINLRQDFQQLLRMLGHNQSQAEVLGGLFMERMPDVYEMLLLDAQSIFEGDPAAKSIEEVVLSYPGFLAICIYRLAHEMIKLDVLMLPRMMTEYAHSRTGIDIHPGATIGRSFYIDHGTGIVIGETANIGNHVKVYQGVTIGALSVKKGCRETKRHPSIEDGVTIYAGATILGGNTIVGAHSVIGGNVWLIESVPPHSLVSNSHEIKVRQKKIKNI